MNDTVSEADKERQSGHQRRAMATLLPYLWPKRGTSEIWVEMRLRVFVALILLVGAKLANVYVPILYSLFEDLQGWAASLARRARPVAQEG